MRPAATTSARVVVSSRLMLRLLPSIWRRLMPAARALAWTAAASTFSDVQRVEEIGAHVDSGRAQRAGQNGGEAMHAAGNADKAFRAVVHGIHAGHHRQQHLRGADVGGGLLAADVLLARLQREAIGRLAFGIDGDADQAARHRALVGVAAGHERGMRAAEAERHAEALGVADHDVRAPFARRGDQGQREQVGGDGRPRRRVHARASRQRLVVADLAERVGVLQQHAEALDVGRFAVDADMQLDAQRFGAGLAPLPASADARRWRRRTRSTSTWPSAWPGSSPRRRRWPSSSSDALAISMPVRSAHMVWKLIRASMRPCEISAWYGV